MSGRFDPSRFIEAERARRQMLPADEQSQTIAADRDRCDSAVSSREGPENNGLDGGRARAVATIATIAGPEGEKLPWDDGLASLDAAACPDGVTAEGWDEIVHEAAAISRAWGRQAHALGWTVHDLFGCPSTFTARRLDQHGLVMIVCSLAIPARIELLDSASAILRCGPDRLTFRRKGLTGPRLIWEASEP